MGAFMDALKKQVKDMSLDGKSRCAKCHSENFVPEQKGISGGKALVGAAIFGPLGLTAGLLGSKKTILVCLNCGHKWEIGKK